jgi:hypothetical protein
MEALQCRIRDEHQKWKVEEERLEIKEIEELNLLGQRYLTSPASTIFVKYAICHPFRCSFCLESVFPMY